MHTQSHADFQETMASEIARLPEEVRAVAGEFCSRGKRVRPMLVAALSSSYGGAARSWLGFGAAVELLHKASLIQDDLPIMDDDATRSGRPTVHTVFTPAHALLASDAMIGHAFRLAGESASPAAAVGLMSDALASLCSGQLKDLRHAGAGSDERWADVVDEKTGALFILSARLGLLAAGRADSASHGLARRLGIELGRLYQLFDDIADGDSAPPCPTAFDLHLDALSELVAQTPDPSALSRYIDQLGDMTRRLLTRTDGGADDAPSRA